MVPGHAHSPLEALLVKPNTAPIYGL